MKFVELATNTDETGEASKRAAEAEGVTLPHRLARTEGQDDFIRVIAWT